MLNRTGSSGRGRSGTLQSRVTWRRLLGPINLVFKRVGCHWIPERQSACVTPALPSTGPSSRGKQVVQVQIRSLSRLALHMRGLLLLFPTLALPPFSPHIHPLDPSQHSLALRFQLLPAQRLMLALAGKTARTMPGCMSRFQVAVTLILGLVPLPHHLHPCATSQPSVTPLRHQPSLPHRRLDADRQTARKYSNSPNGTRVD